MPEAPDSYGEDDEDASKQIADEDDDEAEFRHGPLISDEYEEDHDNERLVEPPPPARPKAFHSPSPSSSRGSTPQISKLNFCKIIRYLESNIAFLFLAKIRGASVVNKPSGLGLVSYAGEDDDEFHQRQSLESSDQGQKVIPPRLLDEDAPLSNERNIGGEQSHPTSDRSHKSVKSEATMDDIDVDELLEKPLEGKRKFS